jgi:hypothetical protein
MMQLRLYWLPGLLGLCALLTLGLLVWPASAADPVARPAVARYSGPDIETRRGGPVSGFALRLAGPPAAPPAATPPEALPVLVGIAGRRVYLRSPGSDEVVGVSIGQSLDGWRLVGVGARAATLSGPDGDRRIAMFAAGAGSPGTSDPMLSQAPPVQPPGGG